MFSIFNRHTLIDDSHETKITEKKRRNKPKLEDPAGTNGLGGLLRRLSKRDRDRGTYTVTFTKFTNFFINFAISRGKYISNVYINFIIHSKKLQRHSG